MFFYNGSDLPTQFAHRHWVVAVRHHHYVGKSVYVSRRAIHDSYIRGRLKVIQDARRELTMILGQQPNLAEAKKLLDEVGHAIAAGKDRGKRP